MRLRPGARNRWCALRDNGGRDGWAHKDFSEVVREAHGATHSDSGGREWKWEGKSVKGRGGRGGGGAFQSLGHKKPLKFEAKVGTATPTPLTSPHLRRPAHQRHLILLPNSKVLVTKAMETM